MAAAIVDLMIRLFLEVLLVLIFLVVVVVMVVRVVVAVLVCMQAAPSMQALILFLFDPNDN